MRSVITMMILISRGHSRTSSRFESFLKLFSNDDDMKKLYVHLYKYDIFAIEVPDKAIEVE